MERHVNIDIEAIPSWEMKGLCKAVLEATKKMLEDPVIRADYEAWLKEYRETHPEKEEGGLAQ